jgi:hypothetical protein
VEPAGNRGQPQRLVDLLHAEHGGQLDGTGHLGAHPRGAGRAGLGQPPVRAFANGQEPLPARCVPATPRPGQVPTRMVRILLVGYQIPRRSGSLLLGS